VGANSSNLCFSYSVCGTDLHTLHGRLATKVSWTLGHESIGIVEEIWEGALTLKKGGRVLAYYGLSCGFCEHSVKGLTAFCVTINLPSDFAFFGL
jgi:glutathione-independent formaldehyde dehydrogenase